MSITVGDAILYLKANQTQLDRDLDSAGKKSQSWASNVGGMVKQAFSFALGTMVVGGIEKITGGIVDMGREALDSYASNERLSLSLETLLARAAKQTFQTLPKMSAEAGQAIQNVQDQYAASIIEVTQKAMDRSGEVTGRMQDQADEFAAREVERRRELSERLVELDEQYAERAASIREQIAEYSSDYADRQTDLFERRAEASEDRKERNAERREKLEAQIGTTKDKKKRTQLRLELMELDAQIEKEEQKIAKREAREDARAKKEHDKRLAQLQARLDAEEEEHKKATAKLERDYAEQTATVKRHYDAQVEANREALAKIETDRQKALAEAQQDLAASMEKAKAKFSPVELGLEAAYKGVIDKTIPSVKDLLKWIQQLAIDSPFTSENVSSSFRMAMAYGFTVTEAKRLTQAMLDFAAGSGASGASMDRIALALGQVRAKGKLAGQEMLQLTEAGLPVGDILAKAFNKSTAEIEDMREKGLLPAQDAIEAIVASIETDFAGAAKAQSTSFAGLLSTISELKEIGLREFFTGTFEAIRPYLIEITGFFQSEATMGTIRGWGDRVGEVLGGILGRLRAAFDRDGIRGVLTEIGAMLSEGWTLHVWPAIQEWAGSFWSWVQGSGGVQSSVPQVLTMVTDGISNFLKNDWPRIEATLNEWGSRFFAWVSTVVVPQIKEKMTLVASGIREWAENPENQARLAQIGTIVGGAIARGLQALVGAVEFWTPIMAEVGSALASAAGQVMPTLMRDVGGKMAQGMTLGLVSELTGNQGVTQQGFSLGLPGLQLGVKGLGGGNVSNTTNFNINASYQQKAGRTVTDEVNLLQMLFGGR